MSDVNSEKVKPFLKWAGGKSQLISTIELSLPTEIKESKSIKEYFEPFMGGGALFFHFLSEYDVEKAYISDINEDLILTYNIIKEDCDELINILACYEKEFKESDYENQKDIFYPRRDEFNETKKCLNYKKRSYDNTRHAANFIFLNKTCFNGLFRVNSKGEFNVPMGRYKNPLICDDENLRNISEKLNINDITIENKSYDYWEKVISYESFVYLDPPYMPVTETSFTSYTKSNFTKLDHINLASFCRVISDNGAKFLLSNSGYTNDETHNKFYKKEYGGFWAKEVKAKRYINRDGKNRGPVNEILICNYDCQDDESSFNLL